LGDRLEGTDATRVAIRATPSHPRLADERIRLPPARFYLRPVRPELSDISLPLASVRVRLRTARAWVPTVSLPLAGVRVRLPPARASVPTVSRPLAGVRDRLPPARARVPTVRRSLAGVRDRLPPARASVPMVSRPLLAMRGLHPAYDGTGHDHEPTALERAGAPPDEESSSLDERRVVPGKRPFAHEFSSSREDKIEPERPRSTARRTGPIIAQGVAGRETSM